MKTEDNPANVTEVKLPDPYFLLYLAGQIATAYGETHTNLHIIIDYR
jgi:hypothetical protein